MGRERGVGGYKERDLQRGRNKESDWRSPRGYEKRDWSAVRSGSQASLYPNPNPWS